MEHLNYFANSHATSIEDSWFGDLIFPSDYIYQQFNVDIYFARSFYPTIIINLIYLGWFIILLVLNRFWSTFRNSPIKIVKFLRDIPQRPINYFDQIWRYQFLTTMWASMLQFTNFSAADGKQGIVLTLCIISFIISIVWPIFIMIYTYQRRDSINILIKNYLYEDIFYLKADSVGSKPSYYLYIGLRFGRLLIYAIFIALFILQSIIGPVILILANLIEILVIYHLDIYQYGLYLFFKLLENLLFIVAAILFMVVYGFRNSESMNDGDYSNLGFGIATIFVLLVINGIFRFFYLIYQKIMDFDRPYRNVEPGEKENYEQ